MFDRILVAVDGSDCAFQGARVGLALASIADAKVDLVHITEPTWSGEGEHASVVFDEVADLAAATTATVEMHTLDGDPAETIVSYANERHADLIVLGREGRSGLGDRLLGSVVLRVLRQADRPVLTVPNNGEDIDITDVLVTTDGSDAAEQAAPYGATLARQHDARVHVCTAVDVQALAGPFDAGGIAQETLELYEQRGQEAVDRLADRIREDALGVSVQTAVVRGHPHEVIETYVSEHDIDIVVMSSVGESSLVGQLLGSVTDRVLRVVDTPVLVVTPDSE